MQLLIVCIMATFVFAVLLCLYRMSHGKRISYGTVIASAAIPNFVLFLVLGIGSDGWHFFTREAWTDPKGGQDAVLAAFTICALISLLPAMAVAAYCQSQMKKDIEPSNR